MSKGNLDPQSSLCRSVRHFSVSPSTTHRQIALTRHPLEVHGTDVIERRVQPPTVEPPHPPHRRRLHLLPRAPTRRPGVDQLALEQADRALHQRIVIRRAHPTDRTVHVPIAFEQLSPPTEEGETEGPIDLAHILMHAGSPREGLPHESRSGVQPNEVRRSVRAYQCDFAVTVRVVQMLPGRIITSSLLLTRYMTAETPGPSLSSEKHYDFCGFGTTCFVDCSFSFAPSQVICTCEFKSASSYLAETMY